MNGRIRAAGWIGIGSWLLAGVLCALPVLAADPEIDAATIITITSPLPSPPEGHVGEPGIDQRPRKDVASMSLIITALAVDSFEQIWAGTSDGQLGVRDPSTGHWSWFPAARPAAYDPITAIAFDSVGRVWVGRTYNGVSVFNGKSWHAYGMLDGPLGEHIYDIQLAPGTGDVWLATNRGISRYRESDHTWSYITRGDGLPSDEIVALAFTKDARLIAATADSGVAIADKGDDYAKWTHVRVDRDLRGQASGDGISSDWCNDVAADADGNVYVATIAGLSFSRDAGRTWKFVRGADYIARARDAAEPIRLQEHPEPGIIGEEYVASVAISTKGELLIGHRRECDATVRNAGDFSVIRSPGKRSKRAYCVASSPGGASYFGTYGYGIIDDNGISLGPDAADEDVEADNRIRFSERAVKSVLPWPARDGEALVKHFTALLDRPAAPKMGTFLGSDRLTGGHSLGRYGFTYSSMPWWGGRGTAPGVDTRILTGPHIKSDEGPYTYFAATRSDDPRHLVHPFSGERFQGEWNDASWQESRYPPEWEGPDLWVRCDLPAGEHRVSLYVINDDPRHRTNFARDYLFELRHQPPAANNDGASASPDDRHASPELERLPVVARARAKAPSFTEGMYVQFLVEGGTWWIKVVRNASPCTKLTAVFVDSYAVQDDPNAPVGPMLAPVWDGSLGRIDQSDQGVFKMIRRLDRERLSRAEIDVAARIAAARALRDRGIDDEAARLARWPTPLRTHADRMSFEAAVSKLLDNRRK